MLPRTTENLLRQAKEYLRDWERSGFEYFAAKCREEIRVLTEKLNKERTTEKE